MTADTATFIALFGAWRRTVTYENLDIQLGGKMDLDPAALFDKIVRRRRGGVCLEQNAVLARLLRLAGFAVTMVEAGVMVAERGDSEWGNHCALVVDVEGQRWFADAAMGDGFVEPLPLREGPHAQEGVVFRLELLDAAPETETWRFRHHPEGGIASTDFRLQPREISDFLDLGDWASTSPDSPFFSTLIVARPVDGGHSVLLSRTLRRLGGGSGGAPRTIGSAEEFAATLAERFRIPLDDLGPGAVERLWERAGVQDDLWKDRSRRNGA
ncbi:arylamine N-acetyltransferase [Streptomyces sp. DSM 44917]|uniref:Arylamine N-acetyltransferase n=1 Tax=Streptomyces boetiae TaxID=3075541 RepID=A0ABU2LBA8_9ACTN|nr:arylamine N-acetyltransferase [Streptomyces sp. DSM 44917]MDT0308866.1 arylamine N-acetyltransferase [Streptomyces sp. DSM 44917]